MTREEAEEYAKNMTYRDAVYNALQGKCVPYRKATLIKLYELLDRLEQESCEDVAKECYEGLCRYFGDAKDILKNREDFKAWLYRINWHIHKVEELWAENNDLRDQLAMRDRLQKQEPCEDCISREAAIRIAEQGQIQGYEWQFKELNKLPPVTPQPKIGRWIDDKCSVCGKGIEDLIDSREWYENEQPNFCPFCGVKIVETQEMGGEE